MKKFEQYIPDIVEVLKKTFIDLAESNSKKLQLGLCSNLKTLYKFPIIIDILENWVTTSELDPYQSNCYTPEELLKVLNNLSLEFGINLGFISLATLPECLEPVPTPLPIIEFVETSINTDEGVQVFFKIKIQGITDPTKTPYVDLVIIGGTAITPNDFVGYENNFINNIPPTIKFSVDQFGYTEEFSLDILNDFLTEGDETILLQLQNPINAILGTNVDLTINIKDTSQSPNLPEVNFNETSISILEGDNSNILFRLNVSPDISLPAQFRVEVAPFSSAIENNDFTTSEVLPKIYTVTSVDALEYSINVAAILDQTTEDSETLYLRIIPINNVTLGTNSQIIINIIDSQGKAKPNFAFVGGGKFPFLKSYTSSVGNRYGDSISSNLSTGPVGISNSDSTKNSLFIQALNTTFAIPYPIEVSFRIEKLSGTLNHTDFEGIPPLPYTFTIPPGEDFTNSQFDVGIPAGFEDAQKYGFTFYNAKPITTTGDLTLVIIPIANCITTNDTSFYPNIMKLIVV